MNSTMTSNSGPFAAPQDGMENNLTQRQKKLLYRAWHRGTREADLMIGRYTQAHIALWDEQMLDLFEEFLDESDADIFDWVSGRQELPVLPCRVFLEEMAAFYATAPYNGTGSNAEECPA